MKKKQLSWRLVQFEIRNITGNIFVIFFGVIFPIFMSVLFSFVYKEQVPDEMYPKMVTSLFITMSMIIPLAVLLIGYAANYSQELEKGIPLRFNLFGFSERTMLFAKMIAYLIFTTLALLVYAVVDILLLDILVPSLSSAICLIVSLYGIAIILFALSHGIASILRKFGPTYAVTMFLYFGFMILSGMMGLTVEQLPNGMKVISKLFPMSYVSSDFIDFWQGGTYRFASLIQSYLFFGAVAFIIVVFSIRKNQRVVR